MITQHEINNIKTSCEKRKTMQRKIHVYKTRSNYTNHGVTVCGLRGLIQTRQDRNRTDNPNAIEATTVIKNSNCRACVYGWIEKCKRELRDLEIFADQVFNQSEI